MIKDIKQKKGIQAIQDLIIEARRLAYEGVSGKSLAEFLDGIEYLPALIIEQKDCLVLKKVYIFIEVTTFTRTEILRLFK